MSISELNNTVSPPPADTVFFDENSNSSKLSTIIPIVIVAPIVVLVIIFIIYKMKKKQKAKKEGTTSPSSAVGVNKQVPGEFIQIALPESTFNTIERNRIARSGRSAEMPAGLSSNQELSIVPTHISSNLTIDELAFIKNCCHKSRKVGEGSFARVYRGSFQGKELAIKEIEHRSPDTKMWVENEVELLQGKEHININKLYAWCIEPNISYLAYLYIDGCSLDDYLSGNCRGFSYSWKQSLGMIMGLARGIEFLHSNKIIHVDIKPQNIMVDGRDNEAKLVDFGFSRHVNWQGTHQSTDNIRGTKGYWAPEYCLNHKISYKHDVYSFGIVVLEMITGKRHVDKARGSSQFHIPEYVRHMIKDNRFEGAVDSRLKQHGWGNFVVNQAFTVAEIALTCAHFEKDRRPDMKGVLTKLTLMVSTGPEETTSPSLATQIHSNLTIDQLASIKSCCHKSRKVGEGSFARVYRGSFQGEDLAIKEIEHRSPDTKMWVENEVKLLRGKEHKNINKLCYWSIEANISYLVYLYIDGCSLDEYLRGNCIELSYSWKQTLRMIMGLARGIEFLHSNKIIHVDIKRQNIMVDAKDNDVKLVDFGFSGHVNWQGTHRSTDNIIGTKGYWPPEYCLNYEHDVYSFGIVVLEMITGQRHVDEARSQIQIAEYVRQMIEERRFEEAVDSRLKRRGWDIFAYKEAITAATIALTCAHDEKDRRPEMNFVLEVLTSKLRAIQEEFANIF